MIAEGQTNKEIAKATGVGESTFYRWRDENENFRSLIKEAQQQAFQRDIEVANASRRKRITFYEYEEVQTEYVSTAPTLDSQGRIIKQGEPIIKSQKKTKKILPPDTTLVMYTLNNLDPENWRHVSHQNVNSEVRGTIQVLKLDDGNEITFE